MGYAGGKYDKRDENRPWVVHPIWRGIGCILIVIIPIMAWAGAELFMKANHFFDLPALWYQPVTIPLTQWEPVNILLSSIDTFFSDMRITYGIIFTTLIFLVLGYGLMSVLYGILYRIFGPPRYTNVDARPITVHRRPK